MIPFAISKWISPFHTIITIYASYFPPSGIPVHLSNTNTNYTVTIISGLARRKYPISISQILRGELTRLRLEQFPPTDKFQKSAKLYSPLLPRFISNGQLFFYISLFWYWSL